MKFLVAASILLATSHGTNAFVVPSPRYTTSSAAVLHASSADPYQSMLDAITTAADAASSAAQTSAQLALSLPNPNANIDIAAYSIMTPEAISAAQAKLSILESNIAHSSDPTVMAKAIVDALDASIHAAEHAVESTSVLTSNLAHFDTALSNSMAMAPSFHLLPPETAEVAQAKLALLLHNLGEGVGNVDDAFVTNLLANVDRKLDSLTSAVSGSSNVSAGTVMMYGTLAILLAHSQRQAGVNGYKMELKTMLEGGDFDINMLAEDVGLPAKTTAPVKDEVQLEDPAIAMAAIMGKVEPVVTRNKKEEEAQQVEALLTTAQRAFFASADATDMEEPKATTTAAVVSKIIADEVEVKNAKDEEALLTTAQTAFFAPVAAAVTEEPKATTTAAAKKVEATPAVEVKDAAAMIEFAIKKEEAKVTVIQKKKKRAVAAPKKKVIQQNRPAASPLARLLAEELGLELVHLGKGTGKNGKILIDDVRKFHARMEEAKKSMVTNMGATYFATVSA